jgi:class 3 adenylate cyclase/tetratricopeptide (TPR) repeat protein
MDEYTQLTQAIAALETQRSLLGDAVVDAALGPMRERLAALQPTLSASQRKQATILFADIAGFTALSETMDAEDIRDTMHALWERLDRVVHEHDGVIDKHMGDGLMALWGAQIAHEDAPERAIRAALAMHSVLAAAQTAQPQPLQMRIGINTGPVLVGVVGTTHEMTAMGDAVNLASRLEHAAPVGGVLISHDTYRHVRGLFEIEVLEPLTVKGKASPIQTYLVLASKPRFLAIGHRDVAGVETRMIGRDADLRLLQAALQLAMTQQTIHTITIVGDAGLGKSRLLYELRTWIESRPYFVRIFQGKATRESQRQPYAIFRDLCAFRFGIQDSDSAPAAHAKLISGVLDFLGADHPDAELKAQLIAHVLGFAGPDATLLDGIRDDPRQIQQRALLALSEVFQASAQDWPLLVALEDVHWADADSLDALVTVAKHCAHVPMLLLNFTRPTLLEERPGWGDTFPNHTSHTLHPLTPASSDHVIAHILRHVPHIPRVLRTMILERADGNPFYIEELIHMLIEHHVIEPQPDQWTIALERLESIQIPPTLIGVLQARLDGLPAAERLVLQHASVIGRVFWDQALVHLAALPVAQVENTLAAIRQRELVYRQEVSAFAAATEYGFKHVILRDVTYASLLKRQRRAAHAQAATWLIAASGARADEYAGLIADHLAAADDQAAAQWYLRAGRHAQAAYANGSAIATYEQARARTPVGTRAAILIPLAAVYELVGQWETAAACYQEGLAEPGLTPLHQAQLQRGLGVLHQQRGEYPEALDWLMQAQTGFATLGATQEEHQTLLEMGRVYLRQASYDRSRQTLEACVARARQAEDSPTLAAARFYLGLVAVLQGDYARAQRDLDAGLALALQRGDRRLQAQIMNAQASLLLSQGDHAQALEHFRAALSVARTIGDQRMIAVCLGNLGVATYRQDDLDAAEQWFQQGFMIDQEMGERLGKAIWQANRGRVALRRGTYRHAAALLSEALVQLDALGAQKYSADVHGALGLVALAEADWATAATHYQQCLQLADAINDQPQRLDGLIGLAAVLLRDSAQQHRAVGILAGATHNLAGVFASLDPNQSALYQRTHALATTVLDPTTFATAWAAGSAMTLAEVLQLAYDSWG